MKIVGIYEIPGEMEYWVQNFIMEIFIDARYVNWKFSYLYKLQLLTLVAAISSAL